MDKEIAVEELPRALQNNASKGDVFREDTELGSEGVDMAKIERVYKYDRMFRHVDLPADCRILGSLIVESYLVWEILTTIETSV